ncbi:MAG: helix-turn-helix transcriptional regulator [Acidimicrobiia bacterium]
MSSERTLFRLSRILALVPYVLGRETVSVNELTERFGYTEEQLARDLDTLFVCGLPGYGPGDLMEAYIDEDEVVIDAADYFRRAPRLTPTEALGLLASGLAVLGMGESNPALESAVQKLMRALVPEAQASLDVEMAAELAGVSELRQAAAEGRVVRITYRSVGKEETTVREVEPWTVFSTLGRWYMVGHCRLVGGERTFRVDRIKELEVLDERFPPPETPPEPGVGYTPSEGDVACVIELGPKARWVLEYYPVEVIRDSGKKAKIRFMSPDVEVPARLLLRLGRTARLARGEEVARRVSELGERLLHRYQ